jgi:hypothetical protein
MAPIPLIEERQDGARQVREHPGLQPEKHEQSNHREREQPHLKCGKTGLAVRPYGYRHGIEASAERCERVVALSQNECRQKIREKYTRNADPQAGPIWAQPYVGSGNFGWGSLRAAPRHPGFPTPSQEMAAAQTTAATQR